MPPPYPASLWMFEHLCLLWSPTRRCSYRYANALISQLWHKVKKRNKENKWGKVAKLGWVGSTKRYPLMRQQTIDKLQLSCYFKVHLTFAGYMNHWFAQTHRFRFHLQFLISSPRPSFSLCFFFFLVPSRIPCHILSNWVDFLPPPSCLRSPKSELHVPSPSLLLPPPPWKLKRVESQPSDVRGCGCEGECECECGCEKHVKQSCTCVKVSVSANFVANKLSAGDVEAYWHSFRLFCKQAASVGYSPERRVSQR